MKFVSAIAVTFVMLAGSGSVSAAPLLAGETVQYQYLYDCITCSYGNASNGNYVVGAGVEVLNIADGMGTLDVSDTNLYVDYSGSTNWNAAAFNGFRITDIFDSIPSFTSVTINAATNMAGFDASRITWDANNIWVNWQGLAFTGQTVVSLDVNGTVPEPGVLALLGLALAGGMRRLRRQVA